MVSPSRPEGTLPGRSQQGEQVPPGSPSAANANREVEGKGCLSMGKSKKMAKPPWIEASAVKSREALKVQFKRKFSHAHDGQGFHGHPAYGYRCRKCRIHIYRIAQAKSVREQLDIESGYFLRP